MTLVFSTLFPGSKPYRINMGNNKKGNICGINQSKEHLKNIIKNEFMKVEKIIILCKEMDRNIQFTNKSVIC